jgi:sigma-B regulation protein RsbU (phosphoserine phosphatase)
MPKKMPRIPYGKVAYMKRSLKGLNGDFFDVIPIKNGKTMIAICEVAGKGVPAGLVMVMIRTILRLISSDAEDARSIITMLNNDMTEKIAIENYASVGITVIEQDGSFTYSSAAHYPMQLIRAENMSVENIQTEGIPIGVDKNTVYTQQKGKLDKEDLLILFTDGIPEARNRSGKHFGIENLINTVKSAENNNPENITELLKTEIEFFERGTFQKDDQTTVVFKYTGGEK